MLQQLTISVHTTMSTKHAEKSCTRRRETDRQLDKTAFALVTECYSGDETKDHEIGGACSIC